jgi:hypothetical protein
VPEKEEEKDKARARRAAAKDDKKEEEPQTEAQALRRAEAVDKDQQDKEAKPLRRAERLEDPDDAPKPEETREEPEPKLTELRREPTFGATASPPAPGPPLFHDGFAGSASVGMPPPRAAESFERPTVQIDRLDVLVQEPAASAARGGLERSRSIRARYLRRL